MNSLLQKVAAFAAAGAMMLTMTACGNKQGGDSSNNELTGDNGKDYADSVGNASRLFLACSISSAFFAVSGSGGAAWYKSRNSFFSTRFMAIPPLRAF